MQQSDNYNPSDHSIETDFEEFWKDEVSKQNEELARWIDDFLDSQEFQDHLMKKQRHRGVFTDAQTQTYKETTQESTKKHASIKLIHNKIQDAILANDIQNTIRNQNIGISIIKEKIEKAKCDYLKYKSSRIMEENINRNETLKYLRNQYGIVFLPKSEAGKLVFRKIDAINDQTRQRNKQRRKNTYKIVQKLTGELKYENKIKRFSNKIHGFKKLKRFVPNLEVIGSKIKLVPSEGQLEEKEQEEEQEIIDFSLFEPNEGLENEAGPKAKILKKDKKRKKSKDSSSKITKDFSNKKSKRKTKKPKKKKNKKDKKRTKKKSASADCLEPTAPIVKKRKKIQLNKISDYDLLLEELNTLELFLKKKESYEFKKLMESQNTYPEDKNIQINPPTIFFKNFVNDQRYRKKVIFKNTDHVFKKVRYEKLVWNADIDDVLLIEPEPLGTQNILPGLFCELTIHFSPVKINKSLEANLHFITYKPSSKEYRECVLRIKCEPINAEILVEPEIVRFEKIPIWKTIKLKEQNFKIINVRNNGANECKVVISKVFKPLAVEDAWKNISSTIDEKEVHGVYSDVEDQEENKKFPVSLLQECVENAFNVFKFSHNTFNLRGGGDMKVKVWLGNIENPGSYVEMYSVNVFEECADENSLLIGEKNIIITAETFGHFLIVEPEVLDFEVCSYGSIYELVFKIFNPTKSTHRIRIRCSSSMRHYLTFNCREAIIPPKTSYKVFIKFFPRLGVIEHNYCFFDKNNELFEFPVFIHLATPGWEDSTPMSLNVFAAVTESLGLKLRPSITDKCSSYIGDNLINLGSCLLTETIWTDIEIFNNTLIPQQYGFLNLPKEILIVPNYGFGVVLPKQRKVLQLLISPNLQDKASLDDPHTLHFLKKITAHSIKELGSIKKPLDLKRVGKKLTHLENIVKNPPTDNILLLSDINELQNLIANNLRTFNDTSSDNYEVSSNSRSAVHNTSFIIPTAENEEMEISVVRYETLQEKGITIENNEANLVEGTESLDSNNVKEEKDLLLSYNQCTNILWIKSKVIENFCELSSQYIYFPDTPCGSYSIASIKLRALKKLNLWQYPKKTYHHFIANLEILGESEEIFVEPNVGKLTPGNETILYFIVRPQILESVIKDKVRWLKSEEMHRLKMEDKHGDSKKNKKKKTKLKSENKSSSETKKDNQNDVKQLGEENVITGYFDNYPAEMQIWRTLEPYCINATFSCKITYEGNCSRTSKDVLYINAICRVVQPDFIHDHNLQCFDFGCVAIGASCTKNLKLQNIQDETICPTITPLNPYGPFRISTQKNTEVPPEFHLNIPIIFSPTVESEFHEFFEVRSRSTIYHFTLRGESVNPEVIFKPEYLVYRLETGKNGFVDCNFEVFNKSKASIDLVVEKVCELKGEIRKSSTLSDKQAIKKGVKSPKLKPKSKKREKSPKSKKSDKKLSIFSDLLYENEIESLKNSFAKSEDTNPKFQVIGENTIHVKPEGKANLTIRFGSSENKTNKKKKKKSEDKHLKEVKGRTGTSFVAKYNFFVGGKKFVKDLIFIGSVK